MLGCQLLQVSQLSFHICYWWYLNTHSLQIFTGGRPLFPFWFLALVEMDSITIWYTLLKDRKRSHYRTIRLRRTFFDTTHWHHAAYSNSQAPTLDPSSPRDFHRKVPMINPLPFQLNFGDSLVFWYSFYIWCWHEVSETTGILFLWISTSTDIFSIFSVSTKWPLSESPENFYEFFPQIDLVYSPPEHNWSGPPSLARTLGPKGSVCSGRPGPNPGQSKGDPTKSNEVRFCLSNLHL